MAESVAGFPFWEIDFDERGGLKNASQEATLIAELPQEDVTDLFVFSHGWNNNRALARALYQRFFEVIRQVLDARPPASDRKVGVLGIIWPAMRWADEGDPVPETGGAAGVVPQVEASDEELVKELTTVFTSPGQVAALLELATLLEARPDDSVQLERFQQLMKTLSTEPDVPDAPEDGGDEAILEQPATEVFDRLADLEDGSQEEAGGPAAGVGDVFGRLWRGAKSALRTVTYWQMKRRAGVVGRDGLGPLLGRIYKAHQRVGIHLLGHSFGARLVSFSLLGLPSTALHPASAVKSLVLIQGAFSHFAFAAALPHEPARGGALAGVADRVDGPLVATYSIHDSAVGRLYPAASIVVGDDASAVEDLFYRWGAIGHDGAQAVEGTGVLTEEAELGKAGEAAYPFASGRFLNLNGNDVIAARGGVSGAHSDIHHPEIAWAAITASGLVGP